MSDNCGRWASTSKRGRRLMAAGAAGSITLVGVLMAVECFYKEKSWVQVI